jgi:hypothetical protein
MVTSRPTATTARLTCAGPVHMPPLVAERLLAVAEEWTDVGTATGKFTTAQQDEAHQAAHPKAHPEMRGGMCGAWSRPAGKPTHPEPTLKTRPLSPYEKEKQGESGRFLSMEGIGEAERGGTTKRGSIGRQDGVSGRKVNYGTEGSDGKREMS